MGCEGGGRAETGREAFIWGQVQTWHQKLLKCLICAESYGGRRQGTMLDPCQPHTLPGLMSESLKELQQDYDFTSILNILLEAMCVTLCKQSAQPFLLVYLTGVWLSIFLSWTLATQSNLPLTLPTMTLVSPSPPPSNWVFLETS